MRLRNITGSENLISQSEYVCTQAESYRGKWNSFFQNENPIHIEIGMGKGKFILEMAKHHPHVNYIGIEKYSSVVYRAVQKMDKLHLTEDRKIANLMFICMDAEDLESVFGKGEVDRIYLNFSDPWPKDRHARRRLPSRSFLDLYGNILKNDGTLEFKTDNEKLFRFAEEELEPAGWKADQISYDLHRDIEMMKGNVMTEYEEKFSALGNPIFKYVISRSGANNSIAKVDEKVNANKYDISDKKMNEYISVDVNKKISTKEKIHMKGEIQMEVIVKGNNFQKEVLDSDLPVLVDFYADWCGPCKMMAPVVAGLAQEYLNRCKVGKCNIDEEMELASRYHILSIPTIIIFKNGEPKATITGAIPKNELVSRLEQVLD